MQTIRYVRIILSILFCILIFRCYAQNNNALSRCFFPIFGGINTPLGDVSSILKTGPVTGLIVEYRFKKSNSFFARIDYDILSNKYSGIISKPMTNVTSGKLNSTILIGGLGYRITKNNWGFYGYVHGGMYFLTYQKVQTTMGDVQLKENTSRGFFVKSAIGGEYYVNEKFILFIESSYATSYNNAINTSRLSMMNLVFGISTSF